MTLVVHVAVDPAEVELVSDELWTLGAVAVGEEPVGDAGVRLEAAFADDAATRAAWVRLSDRGAALVEVADGWQDEWRRHAGVVRVGRVVVVPAWLPVPPVGTDDVVVVIEPGRTFGHGAHATTRLVLGLVLSQLRSGDRVLDVGCGSGVLGLAAAGLGARSVVALDIDDHARAVTAANAAVAGLARVVEVVGGALDDVDGRFDLVLANVLPATQRSLAPELLAALAPGGRLIVSGLLEEQADDVRGLYPELVVLECAQLDGWAALALGRVAAG